MPVLLFASVTLHVLAALLWLGGMFFLGVVGAPVLRQIEPPELRQRLFTELGQRFRGIGWGAIGVLVITGIVNLQARGLLDWERVLGNAEFWSTTFGRVLALKLLAVTTMIAVSLVHDFVHGPAAGRAIAGTPEALALRKRAAALARWNAILGIGVVVCAVWLARGR